MTTRTLVDTDSVQIVANKWLDDMRQYQQNVDTLWKHGTINAALANIGTSTNTTIVVTENTAVNANTDLTSYPNIKWRFFGSGKLTPAAAVTLTLYSPDTIDCDPTQQCLDATSGTITFAQPGTIPVGWFGAKNDNSTQSVAKCQKAVDAAAACSEITMLAGNYLFNDTLTLDIDKGMLRGSGIASTKIVSTAAGVPTIKVSGELVFVTLKDFWISGNGLTGVTGNGHGISLLDPTPDTGAYAPQQCLIDNVRVDNCRGNDSDGRSGSMLACGIAQVSTLENVIRRCYIDTNGHGVYVDTCFTPRIYDSVIINNDKYGVYAVGSTGPIENLFMTGNDILNNGDSGTFTQTGWASAPTGNVFMYNVQGLNMIGNKYKNGDLSGILLHFVKGASLSGNWIRADNQIGLYIRNSNGISVTGNQFDCTSGSTNATEYMTIEMESGHNSNAIVVEGNIFRFNGGKNITHCIKIVGDAAARRLQASSIQFNYFGDESISSTMTCTNAINVVQALLQGTSICKNVFYAETNATITTCFRTDANCSFVDFHFNGNQFQTNGGTITNQRVIAALTFPTQHYGTGTPEAAVTAYIGSTYARLDGGAGTSQYKKESGTGNTGWVAY